MTPPAFQGFGPGFAAFFAGLAEHQSRDWFEAHKSAYECCVKLPVASLVLDASAILRGSGIELWGDAKQSVFRIQRDVRFSRDKTPYKTHASAILSRNGSKKDRGILYLHLDAAAPFLAAGFHTPEPDVLGELRDQIAMRPDRFRALRGALAQDGLTFDASDTLQRLPRGYDYVSEPDLQAAVKLKSLIVRRALAPQIMQTRELLDATLEFGRSIDKLIAWGRGEA